MLVNILLIYGSPSSNRPTATCSRPEDCGIASATVGQWIRASGTDTSLPARLHNEENEENGGCRVDLSYPIGSMYAIYANIGAILMVNVTIYSIHGSYGYV